MTASDALKVAFFYFILSLSLHLLTGVFADVFSCLRVLPRGICSRSRASIRDVYSMISQSERIIRAFREIVGIFEIIILGWAAVIIGYLFLDGVTRMSLLLIVLMAELGSQALIKLIRPEVHNAVKVVLLPVLFLVISLVGWVYRLSCRLIELFLLKFTYEV